MMTKGQQFSASHFSLYKKIVKWLKVDSVCKMSQIPRAQGDFSKLLVFSGKQSKTLRSTAFALSELGWTHLTAVAFTNTDGTNKILVALEATLLQISVCITKPLTQSPAISFFLLLLILAPSASLSSYVLTQLHNYCDSYSSPVTAHSPFH